MTICRRAKRWIGRDRYDIEPVPEADTLRFGGIVRNIGQLPGKDASHLLDERYPFRPCAGLFEFGPDREGIRAGLLRCLGTFEQGCLIGGEPLLPGALIGEHHAAGPAFGHPHMRFDQHLQSCIHRITNAPTQPITGKRAAAHEVGIGGVGLPEEGNQRDHIRASFGKQSEAFACLAAAKGSGGILDKVRTGQHGAGSRKQRGGQQRR